MKRFAPTTQRLRISLLGVAATLAPSLVMGQELDLRSLNDARISDKFDQRLGEQLRGARFTQEREGVALAVFASMAYDDNIFRSATNPQEDFVTTVAPEIRYVKGQPEGRAWVSLAYRPTAVLYLDEGSESRVDHLAVVKVAVRRKTLRLAYEGSWAKLGFPDADVGGAPDRHEWDQRVIVGWDRRGKTSVEIFAEWALEDQKTSVLNDVEATSGGITFFYEYSPKTMVGMTYQVGEVEVESSPNQDFQRITGRINWRPRPHLSTTLEVGGEFRDFGPGGDQWEPLVAGRLQWKPRSGTEIYVSGYRREEVSAIFDGQNFSVLGIACGLSQRLINGWSVRLEGGWEDSEYYSTTGGVAGRSDTAVYIRPSVVYDAGNDVQVQIYYQWSDSDSNNPLFGYQNNEIGVSANYLY